MLLKIQIKGKESKNSYQELKRSRKGQAHTNTRKLNRDISTVVENSYLRAKICWHQEDGCWYFVHLDPAQQYILISLHPSLSQPPGGTFRKLSSDAVFVIYSLSIEEDGCASRNISIQFPRVCVCLSLSWSLQFLVRVFSFLSLNL